MQGLLSLWNPAAKGRQGYDVAVLLGWCSIHKHDKTPVLIHDSVINFDFGVIVENLTATYNFIHFDNVSSKNIGEGGIMNGDRRIEVGMHKDDFKNLLLCANMIYRSTVVSMCSLRTALTSSMTSQSSSRICALVFVGKYPATFMLSLNCSLLRCVCAPCSSYDVNT